jgi:deazaflavin-dependent oxidoreductase (nitroreductase family)
MNLFTKIWNQFNKIILPTPLHQITSKNTILITFKGRKSRKEYTTPVNYSQIGNTIRVTSFHHRSWWRNLDTNPEVIVTLRGQKIYGIAEVFKDRKVVADQLAAYLEPIPFMARYFKVTRNPDGSYNEEDLFKSAEDRIAIKVELADPGD